MTKHEQLLNHYESLDLKRLSEVITRPSYEYHLVERTKAKCLYKQIDRTTQKIHAYEVFRNRITSTLRFKTYEALRQFTHEYIESYPKDEAFGVRAWTYPRLDLAKQKYDSL